MTVIVADMAVAGVIVAAVAMCMRHLLSQGLFRSD
jgi:hypothetical protein